nr:gpn-loop gtpase 2 [Quercus suber]
MKTLLLPIGPPGSGKSTLCNGLQQFTAAISRPCSVANLDPANENIPYNPDFDVRDLVDVDEVMDREELGPNGGVLWAMEEIDANFDWIEERLTECGKFQCYLSVKYQLRSFTLTSGLRIEELVILDPPGQPELSTHHEALPRILQRIEKLGYRVGTWFSSSLFINVLTKIDNLKSVGGADLPFNLDFYTEVQDLNQLLPALEAEQKGLVLSADMPDATATSKFSALNSALISLVEDFGLVSFETLAIEDKASMASLLQAIDRASGFAFAGARATDEEGRTLNDEASVWAQAMSEQWQGKMDIRDIQERWIERKEEFDEAEQKAWEEEARLAGALPKEGAAAAVRRTVPPTNQVARQDMNMADPSVKNGDAEEDELLAAQAEWAKQRGSENEHTVVRRKQ